MNIEIFKEILSRKDEIFLLCAFLTIISILLGGFFGFLRLFKWLMVFIDKQKKNRLKPFGMFSHPRESYREKIHRELEEKAEKYFQVNKKIY